MPRVSSPRRDAIDRNTLKTGLIDCRDWVPRDNGGDRRPVEDQLVDADVGVSTHVHIEGIQRGERVRNRVERLDRAPDRGWVPVDLSTEAGEALAQALR